MTIAKKGISIITPVFNRANQIAACIESVISQKVNFPLTHIIVDDGSSDNISEVVRQYQELNSNIRFLSLEKNSGVNAARNKGILYSKTEFIFFLDSDDQLVEGALSNIEDVITSNLEIQHFIFPISCRANGFLNEYKKIYFKDWINDEISGDFTHVVKASVLKSNLFFEQFRAYESLNWLRIFKQTSPMLLVPLVATRVDANSSDSLSLQLRLNTAKSISDKYNYLKLYSELYEQDLSIWSNRILSKKRLEMLCLGIASLKHSFFLNDILNKKNSPFRRYSLLLLCPSFVMRFIIISYSTLKIK